MGTYYEHTTRQNLINDLIKGWDRINEQGVKISVKVLAHALRGNRLWKVMEITTGDKVERLIQLDLLTRYDGMVGYKPMDETMGPYYWDCPKKFLKNLTPPSSEYSANWCERVLARYKKPLTTAKP